MDRTSRGICAGLFVVALSLRLAAARFGGLSGAEAYLWVVHPGVWGGVVHALGLPSPMGVRVLCAGAGALAVPVVFLLGCRLHSQAAGLWAGGMAALSYAAWFQESQMLPAGLVTLCVIYTAWFSLRANDAPIAVPWWGLYGVACLIMPLLEPSAVFADLALLVVAIASPGARVRLAAGAGAGMLVGLTVWHGITGISGFALLDLPSRLLGLLLPLYLAPWRASLQAHTAWIPFVLRTFDVLIWGLVGLGIVCAAWRARLEGVFGAAWVVCAALLGVPAAGVFYAILAVGLARLRIVWALVIFMAFNLATAVAYPVDSYWWPGNWQEVKGYIEAARDPTDGVMPADPQVAAALQLEHVPTAGTARQFLVATHPVNLPDGYRVQQVHVVPGLNRGAQVTVYLLVPR